MFSRKVHFQHHLPSLFILANYENSSFKQTKIIKKKNISYQQNDLNITVNRDKTNLNWTSCPKAEELPSGCLGKIRKEFCYSKK